MSLEYNPETGVVKLRQRSRIDLVSELVQLRAEVKLLRQVAVEARSVLWLDGEGRPAKEALDRVLLALARADRMGAPRALP